MQELNNPQHYTKFIDYVLTGLPRGNTKIAAGIGTWSNISFVESMVANTSLDCIAIHVYPVAGEFLPKAIQVAEIASRYKKGVILDECWLYKTETAASNIAANNEIFRRDAFSFWAPIDEQFLVSMVKFCRMYHVEYLSPFWANFFFASLDYSQDNADLSYNEIVAQVNNIAVRNILDGKYSAIGEYYIKLIQENR
jgi:hypothetical protein